MFIKSDTTIMNKKILELSEITTKERCISLLICAVFCFESITEAFCRSVRLLINNTFSVDTFLCYLLLGCILLKAVPMLLPRIKLINIIWMLAVVVFVLISSFWSMQPELQYKEIWNIVLYCIPAFIICTSLHDVDDLYHCFHHAAIIMLITQAILLFVNPLENASTEAHSQMLGYNVLFSFCVFFSEIKRKKSNIVAVIGIVLSCFLILISGTRGPFLCIIIYVIMSVLISLKRLTVKKIIKLTIGLFSCILIYINNITIIRWMNSLFSGIGYSDRIFNKILSENISVDLSRDNIYLVAINYIKEHWFIGCGAVNDRIIIYNSTNVWGDVSGAYPHNIFLEIMMQFGIVTAVIILCALLFILFQSLFKNYNNTLVEVILIMFAIGFCPLLVSGSYLSWKYLYALLGICSIITYQKKSVKMGKSTDYEKHYQQIY